MLTGFRSLPAVPDWGMFGVRTGRLNCGISVTESGWTGRPGGWGGRRVLGLTLCSVAVEGGGPIMLISKPVGVRGDMRSRGSSKCHIADRDGPVCYWRGASSASLRFAS